MLDKQLEFIRTITDFEPEIALILGSGLGSLAEEINIVASVDYKDIPDFPVSTAPSHKGRFVFAEIGSKRVVIMQGRVHLYEGYTPQQIAIPIRLMRKMGAEILFLTNASGGINEEFSIGDLMVIDDHISSFIPSPLIGKNDDSIGVRFPDMTEVYSKRLRNIIFETAKKNNIKLVNGVYLQFRGPAFETPAEIKMAKVFGADAVGMSTAIEAQVARHCGLDVCGISVIANMASGINDVELTADDVNKTADIVAPIFKRIVTESIKEF